MRRYFGYMGAIVGLERYETAEEAREAVQAAGNAKDGGWESEPIEGWCWGEVREVMVDTDTPEGPLYSLVTVPNPEVNEHLNARVYLEIELAEARGEVERLQAELATALALLTRYGGIDGAHHKDWAIDQAIRVMCGVPCGKHGFPGEATNEEYRRHVYEACKGEDGAPGEYEWSYGVAP